MKNTTVDTIEAHSASRYCVLLCLGGGAIVWQHTAHLSVAVMGRGLSDRRVQMLNSFYPVARPFMLRSVFRSVSGELRDDKQSFGRPACPNHSITTALLGRPQPHEH